MGAWGMGPFENDGALDCFGDLFDGGPSGAAGGLSGAMSEVTDTEEYIENPGAEVAVAAAVLVAARLGASVANPSAKRLLESLPFEATDELRTQVMAVLDRLADPRDNEWHELWDDAGQLDVVWDLLTPYREVLISHSAPTNASTENWFNPKGPVSRRSHKYRFLVREQAT